MIIYFRKDFVTLLLGISTTLCDNTGLSSNEGNAPSWCLCWDPKYIFLCQLNCYKDRPGCRCSLCLWLSSCLPLSHCVDLSSVQSCHFHSVYFAHVFHLLGCFWRSVTVSFNTFDIHSLAYFFRSVCSISLTKRLFLSTFCFNPHQFETFFLYLPPHFTANIPFLCIFSAF